MRKTDKSYLKGLSTLDNLADYRKREVKKRGAGRKRGFSHYSLDDPDEVRAAL